ncbi:unnamed protein product [Cylicocyclus nassatus]|uniref:STAS domain-containing protein n=1 Tax=Cylicocyclus nassatus TaxID=53992 RepID=A0AA36HEQ8_CYLNA|nr:unnamed protein product [Cylicocyclus nassatus]
MLSRKCILCEENGKENKTQFLLSRRLLSMLYRRVPVTKWIQGYHWKYIFSDTSAGLTMGIFNVPQGMAYSVLASLTPVYGLYASFFPPLLYFFFGSSRHISIGVFSITCLMVGQARLAILPDNVNGTHATEYKGMTDLTPVDVIIALAFVTGTVQIVLWILHLSFLSAYLSDSVVSGLTFGAAVHAFIAQIPSILGIKAKEGKTSGFLHIFSKLYGICIAIPSTNVATVILSAGTMLFLLLCKHFIEPPLIRRKIPLPSELIALIVTTILSRFLHFHERFGVKIVSHVPVGLPAPSVPRFELAPYLIGYGVSIAVVAYVVTLSMGKLFARKHKYQIDNDQEMLALGLTSFISSFFSVFPTSTSLSRSLINENAGAKTQVSGLISACAILCVILFIAPVLESLPNCVLSSIVAVALLSLLKKIAEVPYLWKFSKTDVIAWVATALGTFCWDIIEGLACGVVVALMTIIIRTQRPTISQLGRIGEHKFRCKATYTLAVSTEAPVIRFDAPVIFTNTELLKSSIRSTMERELNGDNENTDVKWRGVIVDCRSWTHTDAMGVEAVKEINEEMLNKKVLLIFAKLNSAIRIQYARAGLFKHLRESQFCPSLEDALTVAKMLQSDSQAFFQYEKHDSVGVL